MSWKNELVPKEVHAGSARFLRGIAFMATGIFVVALIELIIVLIMFRPLDGREIGFGIAMGSTLFSGVLVPLAWGIARPGFPHGLRVGIIVAGIPLLLLAANGVLLLAIGIARGIGS